MQSIGLSDLYIKRINTIMFKFIWNSKANNKMKIIEKVKRDYICKNKECGGLGMTDLSKLQDSFYLKWADKLLTEPLSDSGQSWKIKSQHIFLLRLGGFQCLILLFRRRTSKAKS